MITLSAEFFKFFNNSKTEVSARVVRIKIDEAQSARHDIEVRMNGQQ